jgi:hypothetical protein
MDRVRRSKAKANPKVIDHFKLLNRLLLAYAAKHQRTAAVDARAKFSITEYPSTATLSPTMSEVNAAPTGESHRRLSTNAPAQRINKSGNSTDRAPYTPKI